MREHNAVDWTFLGIVYAILAAGVIYIGYELWAQRKAKEEDEV